MAGILKNVIDFFLSVSKYYLFIKISLNNLILCLKIFRKLEMFLNLEI